MDEKLANENSLSVQVQSFTVDTSFLDFFKEKKKNLSSHSVPVEIENEVKKKLERNFQDLKAFGDKICQKVHFEVEAILKNERHIEKQMRKNLIVKLKEFLLFFKSLNIPGHKINIFPMTPYFHPKAQIFIEAAKFGRTDRLKSLIEKENNEIFVYEYDNLLLTALHWAIKRNHTRTAEFLIQNNSFVNSLDIFGRPPLFYAILNKNSYVCYHLLLKNANPWSCKGEDYLEMARSHTEIYNFIKKFRRADIYLRFIHFKEKESVRKRLFSKIQEPKVPIN